MLQLKKILCPVDFSETSSYALQFARYLMQREDNASLFLLHVIDSRVFDYGGPIYEQEFSGLQATIDQSTRIQLENKLSAEIPEDIRNKTEITVEFGVPFVEIIRFAKDNDIDIIVIGTHGRTGIAHMVMGSVAEKVVRKAPCPVLSVKSK